MLNACLANANSTQVRFAAFYANPELLAKDEQNALIIPAIVESELIDLKQEAVILAESRRLSAAAPNLVRVATEVPKKNLDALLLDSACRAIQKMREAAKDAVPELVAAYDDYLRTEGSSPIHLLQTIGRIGTYPDVSVPLFEKVMDDPLRKNQAAAPYAAVLVKNNMDLTPVIDHAKEMLEAERVQINDLGAITKELGEYGKPLARTMIDRMKSESKVGYSSWEIAVGHLGKVAKEAAPFIRQKAREAEYPESCLLALANIKADPTEFTALVEKMLDDDQKKRAALLALAEYGPGTEALIPKLMKEFEESSTDGALFAISAMGKIDRATTEKLKGFALKYQDGRGSTAAAVLLRLYPNNPKGITFCLSKMSRLENDQVRNMRRWLEAKLDHAIAVGRASEDTTVQQVAERLSEDPPDDTYPL